MGITMEQLSYHIEWLEPSELIPYEANAKLHSAKNVANIANSIKRYGWQQNITITKDKVIIIGHGRQLAALQLGVKCPCKVIEDDLTEDDIRELRIADNLTHDGEYDWETMSDEISRFGLEFEGFDFDLGDELGEEDMTDGPSEVEEDDYDEEPPEKPKIVRGDLVVLGRHRMLCGDSAMIGDFDNLMNGVKADMLLTSPPSRAKKDEEEYSLSLADAFTNANMAMKPGAVFYIWYDGKEAYSYLSAIRDAGWEMRQQLIWNKSKPDRSKADYGPKHEPCIYGWRDGSEHLWAADRKQTTVINWDVPISGKGKPIGLYDYCIKNNTKGGDVVLDVFSGAGTTLMACEQNGRVAYCMESSEKLVESAVNRFVQFTGKGDDVYIMRGGESLSYAELFDSEGD